MLSAWRALYRHLLDAGRGLVEDPTAGRKPPKSARRLPSALSPEEAARLVEIREGDPLATRDRAILELAYSSGLRLSELAGLDVARVDLDQSRIDFSLADSEGASHPAVSQPLSRGDRPRVPKRNSR
jgi:integrase/recombinase XerC